MRFVGGKASSVWETKWMCQEWQAANLNVKSKQKNLQLVFKAEIRIFIVEKKRIELNYAISTIERSFDR